MTITLNTSFGQPVLQVELMREIPKGFDGCIISYAMTENALEQKDFVLFDGWDGIKTQFSYIKVNGQMERLLLTEQIQDSKDVRDYQKKFENELYSATLTVQYLRSADNVSYYNSAVLTLTSKEGNSLKVELIGLSRC